MPIPGPRTQYGPVSGYDNPGMESPDRFNLWLRPGAVTQPGRTPGLMVVTLRGCHLAAGQVRRLWRQTINFVPGSAPFSWTENGPAPGRPVQSPGGFGITRALRYLTQSVYVAGGTDNTRFLGLHTQVPPKVRSKRVTINTGQRRGTPTTRNRISSFGSRVPPLNPPIPAAEDQQNG